MYLTSGANVRTSRSRSRASPDSLYCCHRASVCSELRRFVDVAMLGMLLRGRERGTRHLSGVPAHGLRPLVQMLSLGSRMRANAQVHRAPAEGPGRDLSPSLEVRPSWLSACPPPHRKSPHPNLLTLRGSSPLPAPPARSCATTRAPPCSRGT